MEFALLLATSTSSSNGWSTRETLLEVTLTKLLVPNLFHNHYLLQGGFNYEKEDLPPAVLWEQGAIIPLKLGKLSRGHA